MTRILHESLKIVQDNRRSYIFLNVFFYGLVALGAAYISQYPEVLLNWQHGAKAGFQHGWLAPVYQVYAVDRNIPLAALLTFTINLVVGSGLMLSLPSFVIPFSGLIVSLVRFATWGLLFGPEKILQFAAFGTLFLEGQGYILTSLAIVLQGTRMLRPKRYGFTSLKEAYSAGFKLTARLYVLVAIVLLISALFESTSAITTSKPLFPKSGKSFSLVHNGDRRVPFSASAVFFSDTNIVESDARVVGTLLEDMDYFRPSDTTFARVSRNGATFNIELFLPSSYWENKEIQKRFGSVCKELNHSFVDRRYQITAISVDSSGNSSEKVFY